MLPRVTQMLDRLAVPPQHTVLWPILLRIHKMKRYVQSAALIGIKKTSGLTTMIINRFFS